MQNRYKKIKSLFFVGDLFSVFNGFCYGSGSREIRYPVSVDPDPQHWSLVHTQKRLNVAYNPDHVTPSLSLSLSLGQQPA